MQVTINKDEILEAVQKQYPLQYENVLARLTVQKMEQQNAELIERLGQYEGNADDTQAEVEQINEPEELAS